MTPPKDTSELVAELRRIARARLENPDLAIEWRAADELVNAYRIIDRLRDALKHSHGAIASLSEDALGFHEPQHEEDVIWPLRDELLHMIDAALSTIPLSE